MKKFLNSLFIFMLPLLAIWAGVEILYRTAGNNYTIKNEQVKKTYEDAEVLILGNSHAFYGLNPDYFAKTAFNLSNVSQGLFIDELLLDKHLTNFKQLKYIVLTIDYFTLSQDDNLAEEPGRKYFYESLMDIETGLISDFDIKKYSLALAVHPQITIHSLKQYYKNGTLQECNSQGWAAKHGVGPDNRPEMGKIIAAKHEDGSLRFDHNVGRLKRVIKICAQRDIEVVLVTMPVTTHYADNVDKSKLRKIFSACAEMESEFQSVKYINLFSDKRFNNNDFYDIDHLNTGGAKKCSEIISSVTK